MDSITQITLGAAVGEAVLGRKIGNKAPLWGAIFGTLPDLDVLVIPFVDEVQALAIHRGLMHSFFFCIVAAPFFGWLLSKYYKNLTAGWKDWSLLVFLAILTHIGIDACTSYGTQVFQPFSNYSLSFNTIFIIDPFYTLPLMAGVVTTLFLRRNSIHRKWANWLGIAISSLYLLAAFGIKWHVNTVFEQNYEANEIHPDQYMTTPAPFTVFLWTGYAVEGDSLYAGLYSIFDADQKVHFHSLPRHDKLLTSYRDQRPVKRLIWFSQRYYAAEKDTSGILVHDIRFGRSDLWLANKPAPYIWNYQLHFNQDSTKVTGFHRFEPSFDARMGMFSKLVHRILGGESYE